MDAVLAMEGEGPGASGKPRQVGLLLASTSPLALDVVAGEIMGLPREQNPVVMAAEKRGLTPCRIDEINVIGEELSALKISDYKFPATVRIKRPPGEKAAVAGTETPAAPGLYPAVIEEKCEGCGICLNACPQKTITLSAQKERKTAVIDPKNCIRCYCCHELCPHQAIRV
jgi:NAD-dependent dihydropyrimidine dehydrogenase PreA subunit